MFSHSLNIESDVPYKRLESRLAKRPPAELKMLQDKFQLSVEQLDDVLAKHTGLFKWNKVKYTLAAWTNITFPFFAGPNSYLGIQRTTNFFTGAQISKDIAYPTGIVLSGLSALYYISAINPEALAIRFTIEYAKRDPFQKRFGDFCSSGWKEIAKYSVQAFALYSTNLLGASTNFIGISDFLFDVHPALWWVSMLSFFYFAQSYYDGFSNDEFWENATHWWDTEKRPSLFREIKNNPALVLQVAVEGMSTVVLRAVGNYFTLSSTEKAIGNWFPASLVVACSFYTYLMQFYMGTYDHYLKNKIHVSSDVHFHALEKKVQAEGGYGFPIRKEPSLLFPLAFRAYIGAYIGATWGVGPAIVGAALLLTWTYRAERARVTYHLMANELAAEEKIISEKTCREMTSIALADTVSYSCAVSNVTFGVGLGESLASSPPAMAAYVIGTMNTAINNLRFARDKVRATVSDLLGVKKFGMFASTDDNPPARKNPCSWFRCGK